MTTARTARGLLLACHPLPSVAVTAFGAAYALSVGLAPSRTALLAAAVLTGQLSVGWCNDWVDAGRDTAAGRTDKPVAAGLVGRRAVGVACLGALSACVVLSLVLGVLPGLLHLAAVGSAWAYDLWLKTTRASAVPYFVSFALLTAVATTALPEPTWPPVAVLVAAGLLGVAAHFANTVGDTAADAATGVRGLPQRVGPQRSLVITAVLVALAAATLLLGAGEHGPRGTAMLGGGAALAAGGLLLGARAATGRLAFRLTLVAVALVVVGFVT